ncbi:MAG: hypothetical protein ACPG5T_02430, partial [Endozoicomonas sp.]
TDQFRRSAMGIQHSRTAAINSIHDGHKVAQLCIDYLIDRSNAEKALEVDLQLSGEMGYDNTHFIMRRDVYYNLPQKINKWLKEHHLVSDSLSAPLYDKGHLHATLALEILTEIHSVLGNGNQVDLDRLISDNY